MDVDSNSRAIYTFDDLPNSFTISRYPTYVKEKQFKTFRNLRHLQ
jgi:hypothetical protein